VTGAIRKRPIALSAVAGSLLEMPLAFALRAGLEPILNVSSAIVAAVITSTLSHLVAAAVGGGISSFLAGAIDTRAGAVAGAAIVVPAGVVLAVWYFVLVAVLGLQLSAIAAVLPWAALALVTVAAGGAFGGAAAARFRDRKRSLA
jgi:hypothetical protein